MAYFKEPCKVCNQNVGEILLRLDKYTSSLIMLPAGKTALDGMVKPMT
jgi:hypothetical protein